ncbi:MAG: inositol 2-dehydrogenase [Marinosulfonomonas sp.]|nr:MAG: inositol 2-dehydrogenase [Marinosulfonomonas sp.]
MTLRFALLGAGRIGLVHAKAVTENPQAKLVAVADAFEETAKSLIATYGGEFRTIDAIAAADDIDAVLICTPTNTHADLIEKFAHAGKAIFCEKPIDLSIERVNDCLKVVQETNATLMVGFNRRFDPHFIALKDTITAGKIGKIEMINIISRDPGAPPPEYIKVSGGIFKDMTIHDFDMARFLLGEEIETVMASASVLVDPEIGALGDFDSANVILTTASGKQCAISNSRRATYGYDQRIEVHGSLGMVAAENQREVSIEVATAGGYTRPPLYDFFMTRYIAAYAGEIAAFIANLAGDMPASPSGEDGLRALAIAQATLKSVNEGRAVKVSEVI